VIFPFFGVFLKWSAHPFDQLTREIRYKIELELETKPSFFLIYKLTKEELRALKEFI